MPARKVWNPVPSLDLLDIYHQYCQKLDDINYEKKYTDNMKWFKASSAGNCHYQHLLGQQFKPDKLDALNLRWMRLGTIVHNDFERALKWAVKTKRIPSHIEVLMEQNIEIKQLNVRGHFDYLIIDRKAMALILWDLKTAKTYKWSLLFGQRRGQDTSIMYQFQACTYFLWVMKTYPEITDKFMGLMYYKKDDSRMMSVEVGLNYIGETIDYWTGVGDFVEEYTGKEDEVQPGVTPCVPMEEWNCKYCSYASHCGSPFK